MYEATAIAERIKLLSRQQKIQIREMLDNCGLSKNTLSSMISGGSTPKSENLAKIADYLNCSVDYLLGRTDNPEVNKASVKGGENMDKENPVCGKCGTPLVPAAEPATLNGARRLDGSQTLGDGLVCPNCHPDLVKA